MKASGGRIAGRLGLLGVCLAALAVPALAQDLTLGSSSEETSSMPSLQLSEESSSVPPDLVREAVPSLEVLQAIFDVCTDVASGDPEALDRARGAGWQSGDYEEGGPFRAINSGYRSFAGYDESSFRSVTDSFPTQRLGYCSASIGDPQGKLVLNDFSLIDGLTGRTEALENGLYGAWESADGKLLVFATFYEGIIDLEFNLLLGPAPTQP